MEAYYQQQSISPYFAGHYRQWGCGFGALAAGIGRAAIPIAKKFFWPIAKTFGRELIVQAAREIVEVFAKKKSPRKALESTVQKTVRKQFGGSKAQIGGVRGGNIQKKKPSSPLKSQKIIQRKQPLLRSRSDQISFPKCKMNTNLLPAEATHTSLDVFEKQPVLTTYDIAFTQVGPSYSQDGPTLEFEVVGNNKKL